MLRVMSRSSFGNVFVCILCVGVQPNGVRHAGAALLHRFMHHTNVWFRPHMVSYWEPLLRKAANLQHAAVGQSSAARAKPHWRELL